MKKIAIFGGTFNPVHSEHVSLVKSAITELGLDKLIVMPTYISPHKTSSPAPAEDRLAMLKLAFNDVEKVEISDYEILKKGKSYTYQTIEHFYDKDTTLYFLVGGDMLIDFKRWKYPERILACATLAVFSREKVFVDYQKEQDYFIKNFNKEFVRLRYEGKDYSSTKIRTYFRLNIPLGDLMPKLVCEYVQKNKVYTPDIYESFILKTLPPHRIKHTADVVITALRKARELGLDQEKVRISATLHDSAKYLNPQEEKGFCPPKDVPSPVMHAFLGAYVAEKYLGITDKEIIDAIRYHTSGKADMTTLGKLIFVADMIEEGRDYEGVDKLRDLYENSDFEVCFRECLKEEFVHLINKKASIYHETINAINYYIEK
ncbi:MAG: nicotinate (nicotinamide) nucleotide adenylyltransferase [Clostridiales bacterium]|nr:nicotinate (nicotinamide) nucleotide adenylyltransferase [Clostridiales bacterium]